MKFQRTVLTLVCCTFAACSTQDPYAGKFSAHARYERYEPSLVQISRLRAEGTNALYEYKIADIDVVNFSDHVKSILRSKFTNARFARYTSATAQVLLSSAAGAAAAFDGGATTVASLALLSSVTPQLSGIFNAKARAETYQDAVRLIEEAEIDFLSTNGSPSSTALTDTGLDLYRRVTTTIHIVEKAIVGQIPTLKDLQGATGRDPERARPRGRVVSRVNPVAAAPRARSAKPRSASIPARTLKTPAVAKPAAPEKAPDANIPEDTVTIGRPKPPASTSPEPQKLKDATIDADIPTLTKPKPKTGN